MTLGGRIESLLGGFNASSAVHKYGAIAFIFFTLAFAVARSAGRPRGALRRMATNYVATLDLQHRAMFLPEAGAKIAWIQLIVFLLALAMYGLLNLEWLPVLSILALIVPPTIVQWKLNARRAAIDEQANGFCLALSNALKATSSIGDALRGAQDVTAKPLKDEISTALQQVRIGSTLEEALLAMSARVQSMSLDAVVSALLVGRQTGGDLPRILETTASSLRDLKRLEKLTDKVVRGAKQSLGVSAMITAGLAIALPRMFPGFFDAFRTSVKGQFWAAQLICLYLFALYLGFRFTRKSI